MSKTVAKLKADIERKQRSLRAGMWVRLKGWQSHWPQRNAKIICVTDHGTAFLDRKILNESQWHITDLTTPFK